jgi:lysophospholipase L1-like esterase
VTNAPASWNYVALGDSLAAGSGAYRGYVPRYADYINSDTDVQVELINQGQSGQTSAQLLYALRNDSALRQALSTAAVITFNVGLNDLGHAGEAYENGTCGGADGQDCLRAAVETFKENWDAIMAELLSLRSTGNAIIRTTGIGYIPYVFYVDEPTDTWPSEGKIDDFQVFEPYVNEINRHIATTTANTEILYSGVCLDKEAVNPDGVHPNDKGHEIIADQLRALGYGPLR